MNLLGSNKLPALLATYLVSLCVHQLFMSKQRQQSSGFWSEYLEGVKVKVGRHARTKAVKVGRHARTKTLGFRFQWQSDRPEMVWCIQLWHKWSCYYSPNRTLMSRFQFGVPFLTVLIKFVFGFCKWFFLHWPGQGNLFGYNLFSLRGSVSATEPPLPFYFK